MGYGFGDAITVVFGKWFLVYTMQTQCADWLVRTACHRRDDKERSLKCLCTSKMVVSLWYIYDRLYDVVRSLLFRVAYSWSREYR